MRYTQTELDKIMMIGFGRVDNAVDRVIASYEAPQIEVPAYDTCPVFYSLARAEAYLRYMSGLQNDRIGATLGVMGQAAYQENALYGAMSKGMGF